MAREIDFKVRGEEEEAADDGAQVHGLNNAF